MAGRPPAELRADFTYLTTVAYADDSLFRDRLSLYDHQHPRVDLVGEVLSRAGDLRGQRVADIGCGNGESRDPLAERAAAGFGRDLSFGLRSSATAGAVGRVAADAQRLPFRAQSLDVALAMHMLYHVPDPAGAVAEAARVLRPGGRFIAAIGGPRHLAEAKEIWVPLLREAGLDTELRDLGLVNSRLEAGRLARLLADNFEDVEYTLLASEVVLRDAMPLVRYASSSTAAKASSARGVDMSGRLEAAVKAAIEGDGVFKVTTEVSLFSARACRGRA